MTNAPPPPGPGGAPSTSYPSGPSISSVPRRSSYASVVSGAAAASSQNVNPPAWSGPLSNLNTAQGNSYPPQYQSESRLHRYPSALEADMQTNGGVGLGSGWRRGALMPSYSRQFTNNPDYGGVLHGSSPSNQFFTPSYL